MNLLKVLIYDGYARSSSGAPKGGSTKSLIDFLKVSISNSPHEYFFLTNQSNRNYYIDYIKPLGIQEIYVEFPRDLLVYGRKYEKNVWAQFKVLFFSFPKFIMKLSRKINKHNIDKVLANDTRAALVLGLSCKITNRQLITFIRSDYGLNLNIIRYALKMSNKLISISEGIHEMLDKQFQKKSHIINEAIDIKNFIVNDREEKSANTVNIVNIANISPYKNQLILVQVMKEIIKNHKNVHLYIVGETIDKSCKDKMDSFIKENGLKEYVTFTGFETDIRKYLKICDIYVQPSINEGLGRSIIEAYSFSIPVIGSSIPGIKSIVKNNFNGLLFNLDDKEQLYNNIITLIEDKQKAREFGENGRNFVYEHFNLENNARKIENLLGDY